jgi:uncharacterized protein
MSVEGRLEYLDGLRGIAIVLMLAQHFTTVLMDLSLLDSPPYVFLVVLGILSAPMFLFLVGVCLPLSVARRKGRGETEFEISKHVFLRGFILMMAGFVFMFLWEGEFLRWIGMFLLITYPLLGLPVKTRLIIGILILAGTPLLNLALVPAVKGFVEDLAIQTSWSSSAFIRSIYGSGALVLFRWFSFVLFGTIIGSLLVHFLREGREHAFQSTTFKLGLVLTGLGAPELVLAIPFNDFPAFSVAGITGLSLLLLSGLMWLQTNHERAFRVLNPLTVFGRLSLSLYLGHIILWLGAFRVLGLSFSLSVAEVLAALFSCYLAAWVLGVFWLKKRPTGPVELLLAWLTKLQV